MARVAITHTLAEIVRHEAAIWNQSGEGEAFDLVDATTSTFQLIIIGWEGDRRIFDVILHLRLHNGKVWVEHDGLPEGVTDQLLAAGVEQEEIVLAFMPPWKRPLTAFAVD